MPFRTSDALMIHLPSTLPLACILHTAAHREDLVLAYAITIHKMQGSEAERVIVFIPKDDRLVDKRMLYTALTRAKSQLELYYYTTE